MPKVYGTRANHHLKDVLWKISQWGVGDSEGKKETRKNQGRVAGHLEISKNHNFTETIYSGQTKQKQNSLEVFQLVIRQQRSTVQRQGNHNTVRGCFSEISAGAIHAIVRNINQAIYWDITSHQ